MREDTQVMILIEAMGSKAFATARRAAAPTTPYATLCCNSQAKNGWVLQKR
jgi:hypothetical protein